MIVKTRGIVLKSFKYGESSQITTIYTEEAGLQKYIISGLRQKKPTISPVLLQALSVVELVAYQKDGKDLHRIREMRPALLYTNLPFDLVKRSIGLFLTELIQKTIRISEAQSSLFDFLLEGLTLLDGSTKPVNNFHLCFMMQFSTYLGIQPSDNYTAATPLFDLREGVFVMAAAESPYTLTAEDSQLWLALAQADLRDCHLTGVNSSNRSRILQHLLRYFKIHLENMPDLHSHEILEQVLRG